MKKKILPLLIFCITLVASCSSSPKEDNKDSSSTGSPQEVVSTSTPVTIQLEEDKLQYSFSNWDSQVIVPASEGLKLLGYYDAKNDIISLENISLKEVQVALKDRSLPEPLQIIIKVETNKGQIVDYTLTKE